MKHKRLRLLIILLLIGTVGAGFWYVKQQPEALAGLQLKFGLISEWEAKGVRSASGFIEAEEISIAAETSGRIKQLAVAEGDFVEAGQLLVTLDTALLEAEMAQAEAKIAVAEAQLAQIKAGVRAEEIAKAEAAVAVAEANAEAVYTLWQDAKLLRDNPQTLDLQIDAARTALALAELETEYTIPLKDAGEAIEALRHQEWAEIQQGVYVHYYDPRTDQGVRKWISFPEGDKRRSSEAWNLATADQWAAWVNLNTAQAGRDDAEIILNDLLRLRNDPQEAQVKVTQAEAAYQTALAEVEVAKSRLEIVRAGSRPEQVAVVETQVRQAEASLAALKVQRDQHLLSAPLAGWVVERTAHEGEMARPGAALLTLADLTQVTLIVYVPEPDIDTVSIGQKVTVFVDAFPGQPFTGVISFIADDAEFTPKNVQTKEERVNTVFAVKIRLENEDQRLKPGMPADAILAGESRL